MKQLTIGKLAEESGVGVETVRFYERKGLIKKPSTKTGFRKYPEEDISRIRFIKRTQEIGFTLKEVQEILELNTSPKATCGDVQRIALLKIKEVEAKIRDLEKMKSSLKKIEKACEKSKAAIACCKITDCFEGKC